MRRAMPAVEPCLVAYAMRIMVRHLLVPCQVSGGGLGGGFGPGTRGTFRRGETLGSVRAREAAPAERPVAPRRDGVGALRAGLEPAGAGRRGREHVGVHPIGVTIDDP